jgi:sphinganine-1-phosphate aldolase
LGELYLLQDVRWSFTRHAACNCLNALIPSSFPPTPFFIYVCMYTQFGQAHKGTSVVLYRSPEIRKYQYTQVTDWSGGNYISPGFAGSRSGALIATAWASMVHLGRQGYVQATANMLELSKRFIEGLANVEPLEVVGKPVMSVIAFRSSKPNLVDIYRVNDLMTARGWHLNALQRPAALHMCFTAAHGPEVVDELLRDLKECVDGLLAHPEEGKGEGMAPLYGQAAAIPDRRVVGKFLTAYQDILLDPR